MKVTTGISRVLVSDGGGGWGGGVFQNKEPSMGIGILWNNTLNIITPRLHYQWQDYLL